MESIIEFDCTIFSNLPQELRNKVVDIKGSKINLEDIDPLDLVCIQISDNPGTLPIIMENSGDFCNFLVGLAKSIDFDLEAYSERLNKKFG